jgi:hypothetical protein
MKLSANWFIVVDENIKNINYIIEDELTPEFIADCYSQESAEFILACDIADSENASDVYAH